MVLDRFKFIVEPILFLTYLTVNLEVSLVQQLITASVCWRRFAGQLDCESNTYATYLNGTSTKTDLTLAASMYISAYDASMASLKLVVSLWFGSWVDKFGRKKLMFVPLIGSIVSTSNFLIVSYFIRESSPWYVLASAVIIGCSTSSLGVVVTCFGVISDTTSKENRSTRVAFLESSIYLGGAVGFSLVGFLKPRTGFVEVFAFELCLHLINLSYIVFIVREPEQSRQQQAETHLFSVQHVLSMIRTVVRPREKNYKLVIMLLLCSGLILASGFTAVILLTYSFLKMPPLEFTGAEYSFYHGGLMAVQGISIVIIMPVLLGVLKLKDTTVSFIGAVSCLFGLLWLSFSTESWMVYTSLILLAPSQFAMPVIRSLASKIVESHEKAKILACLSVLQSLADFTGSFLYVGLFKATSQYFYPGFGFTLAGTMEVIPVVLFGYLFFALDMNSLNRSCQHESPRIDGTQEAEKN